MLAVDALAIHVYDSARNLALATATAVGEDLNKVLSQRDLASVLLATGNSQIEFLDALVSLEGIDWSRVLFFHLDEFLGIEANHPASFRTYLRERVQKRVTAAQFYYLQGDALEPLTECDRYTQLLQAQAIDLCFLGIGGNGHLAFNEPNVANFHDPYGVKLVKLVESTRLAQVKQGHFCQLESVPQYAFTVTLPMLLSAEKIYCLAPGLSKSAIAQKLLTVPISESCPASVLRQHPRAILCLDQEAASLISTMLVP